MLRFLFRLVVLVVAIVFAAALYYGYGWWNRDTSGSPVGTSGASETGAEIAHQVSEGATRAGKAISEGALTSKIRSKMLLDDTIDASHVNVDTAGTVVTVTGYVASKAQKQRVLQLAKETSSVTSVVDRVEVKAP